MPLASVKVSCKGRLLAGPNVDHRGLGDHEEEEEGIEKEEEEEEENDGDEGVDDDDDDDDGGVDDEFPARGGC